MTYYFTKPNTIAIRLSFILKYLNIDYTTAVRLSFILTYSNMFETSSVEVGLMRLHTGQHVSRQKITYLSLLHKLGSHMLVLVLELHVGFIRWPMPSQRRPIP